MASWHLDLALCVRWYCLEQSSLRHSFIEYTPGEQCQLMAVALRNLYTGSCSAQPWDTREQTIERSELMQKANNDAKYLLASHSEVFSNESFLR